MRTLPPDGIPARLVLSVLESAGILYANLSPVIVSGLVQSGAFTGQTAGWIFSVNMVGTAIGGFVVLFFVRRLRWRPVSCVLLAVMILADLISVRVMDPEVLGSLRLVHGLSGGALIGVSMSVIARMLNPERTIAIFIIAAAHAERRADAAAHAGAHVLGRGRRLAGARGLFQPRAAAAAAAR
ncbi:MAG: hypothetical protein AB7I04_10720 [Pseudomonadales bacterium]